MSAMKNQLITLGVGSERIQMEVFGTGGLEYT
jgi:hypothetical protein